MPLSSAHDRSSSGGSVWKRYGSCSSPPRFAAALRFSAARPMTTSRSCYRNGERASGRFDGFNQGQFYLDVSDTDERQIPLGDIALHRPGRRRAGAAGDRAEPGARRRSICCCCKSGSCGEGSVRDHRGRRDRNQTTVVFRARERRGAARAARATSAASISGNFPGARHPGCRRSSAAPATPPRRRRPAWSRVNGQSEWVDTGITVRQGQTVSFESSGEVMLSSDGATTLARPAARARAARPPARRRPDLPVGALIGRIGNGQAFAIGNQTSIVDARRRPPLPRRQRRRARRQPGLLRRPSHARDDITAAVAVRPAQATGSTGRQSPHPGPLPARAGRGHPCSRLAAGSTCTSTFAPAPVHVHPSHPCTRAPCTRAPVHPCTRAPCTCTMFLLMPEWKDTVNLPRTDFPMRANLPTTEPQVIARWEADRLYDRIRERRAGRPEVRPARRPAVRQRRHPHRHRAQQDPQGLHRQVADDGRLRRAVRARAGTATACRSSSRSTASWARRSSR